MLPASTHILSTITVPLIITRRTEPTPTVVIHLIRVPKSRHGASTGRAQHVRRPTTDLRKVCASRRKRQKQCKQPSRMAPSSRLKLIRWASFHRIPVRSTQRPARRSILANSRPRSNLGLALDLTRFRQLSSTRQNHAIINSSAQLTLDSKVLSTIKVLALATQS